jgi:hypothetical protein
LYQAYLLIYSQTKIAGMNIPAIEFPSLSTNFMSIPAKRKVGMVEETCLIAVAECLCLFEDFCYSRKKSEALKIRPISAPDPSPEERT